MDSCPWKTAPARKVVHQLSLVEIGRKGVGHVARRAQSTAAPPASVVVATATSTVTTRPEQTTVAERQHKKWVSGITTQGVSKRDTQHALVNFCVCA